MSLCYNEDGVEASDIPCDPNAEISACCGGNSVCVQNLYCLDPYGANVPGTCTKQDWGSNPSEFCPCHSRYVGNNTLNYKDSVTYCYDGSYCCGDSNFDCCQQNQGWPIVDYGNTATIPSTPTGVALSTYYKDTDVTTLPITRTTSSTSPITSSTRTPSAATQSMTTHTPTPTNTGSAHASTGLSTGAEAGIGVAVALGVIGLMAATFMFYRQRKRTRRDQSASHEFADFTAKDGLMTATHPVSELPTYSDTRPAELATH